MTEAQRIAEVLGGTKVLRKHATTNEDLIEVVRRGLPYGSLLSVVEAAGITGVEILAALAISPRTLARRSKAARLQPAESDRVLRLARIAARAGEVFGDRDKARRWFHKPNRALGNVSPLSLVDTDIGAQKIEDILLRIEHGVLS